jgi:hypothetical protein
MSKTLFLDEFDIVDEEFKEVGPICDLDSLTGAEMRQALANWIESGVNCYGRYSRVIVKTEDGCELIEFGHDHQIRDEDGAVLEDYWQTKDDLNHAAFEEFARRVEERANAVTNTKQTNDKDPRECNREGLQDCKLTRHRGDRDHAETIAKSTTRQTGH